MAKKKIDPKLQTAQEFLNVWGIANNFLYSHDGYIYGYLSVRAKSEALMLDHEKKLFFAGLTSALEADRGAWQLLSIPRTLDTHGILRNLMELRQKADDDAKLNLINGEISAIQEMARNGAKEPMLILKLWTTEGKRAEDTLNKRITMLCNNLNRHISARRLEDREITFLCKVFGDLDVHQDTEGNNEDAIPLIAGKATPEMTEEALLQNLITPVGGLSFKVSQTYVGSVVGRIYGAVRFPSSLDYGWATDIMNCTEAITCITFNPESSNELANALSDSINRNLREAETTRNHRERQRYERQAKDADALISELDGRHEVIGTTSILTMPFTAMGKRLRSLLKGKSGTTYIDAMIMLLVFCMGLSFLLSLAPVYTRHSTQQAVTREIVRYAEQLGRTDGPVADEFDRLCRAASIDATITWDADYISGSRKVQLRNQLSARVASDFEYGIGGFRTVVITIPTKSAGRSEYYWK